MNMQNTCGEYEGIRMVGMLMMYILSISYFCYLIKLAAVFAFISSVEQLN